MPHRVRSRDHHPSQPAPSSKSCHDKQGDTTLGAHAVGRRIAVAAEGSKAAEEGVIVAYFPKTNKYRVRYEHDDRHARLRLDDPATSFLWLPAHLPANNNKQQLAIQHDAAGRRIELYHKARETWYQAHILRFVEECQQHTIVLEESDKVQLVDLGLSEWRFTDLIGPVNDRDISNLATSKYMGVSCYRGAWKVHFDQADKGCFATEKEAALAYDYFARRKQAPVNFEDRRICRSVVKQLRVPEPEEKEQPTELTGNQESLPADVPLLHIEDAALSSSNAVARGATDSTRMHSNFTGDEECHIVHAVEQQQQHHESTYSRKAMDSADHSHDRIVRHVSDVSQQGDDEVDDHLGDTDDDDNSHQSDTKIDTSMVSKSDAGNNHAVRVEDDDRMIGSVPSEISHSSCEAVNKQVCREKEAEPEVSSLGTVVPSPALARKNKKPSIASNEEAERKSVSEKVFTASKKVKKASKKTAKPVPKNDIDSDSEFEFDDMEESEVDSESNSGDSDSEDEAVTLARMKRRLGKWKNRGRPKKSSRTIFDESDDESFRGFSSSDESEAEVSLPKRRSKKKKKKRAKDTMEKKKARRPVGRPPKTRPQRYPLGTRFMKEFPDYGCFEGEVVAYDGFHYHVYYEDDDDEEELSEFEFEDFEILPNREDNRDRAKIASKKKKRTIGGNNKLEKKRKTKKNKDSSRNKKQRKGF